MMSLKTRVSENGGAVPGLPAPAPLPSLRTAFSRRAALFGAVASTGFLAAAAAPVIAGNTGIDQQFAAGPTLAPTHGIGGIWHELMLAQGSLTQAFARLSAAQDRLPWWAKPGPIYVGHNGTMSGPVRGWPAIENHPLPQREGSVHLIRIGPEEIRRRGEHRRWFTNAARAEELRAKDEADLEARYARKAAEELALGIPALTKAHDDAFDVWADLADAIDDLPDGPIDVTAAKVLVEMHRFGSTDATANSNTAVSLAAVALRGLMPHLDGPLAIDVADVLADPNRPLRDMRVSRGLLPNGDVAEVVGGDVL